jgi:hypothetical protein
VAIDLDPLSLVVPERAPRTVRRRGPSSAPGQIAAFLRSANSLANTEQVRKRLEYVKSVRSSGNTDSLAIALADTEDARVVLEDKDLNRDVRTHISRAETIIKNAQQPLRRSLSTHRRGQEPGAAGTSGFSTGGTGGAAGGM